jgi:hypothetical protein
MSGEVVKQRRVDAGKDPSRRLGVGEDRPERIGDANSGPRIGSGPFSTSMVKKPSSS